MKYVSFQPSFTDKSTAERGKEQVTDTACQGGLMLLAALLSGAGSKSGPETLSKKQYLSQATGSVESLHKELNDAISSFKTSYPGISLVANDDGTYKATSTLSAAISAKEQEIADLKKNNMVNTAAADAAPNYTSENYEAYKGYLAQYNNLNDRVSKVEAAESAITSLTSDVEKYATVQPNNLDEHAIIDYEKINTPALLRNCRLALGSEGKNHTVWDDALKGTQTYQKVLETAETAINKYNKAIDDRRAALGGETDIGTLKQTRDEAHDNMQSYEKKKVNGTGDGTAKNPGTGMSCSAFHDRLEQLTQELNTLKATNVSDMDEDLIRINTISGAYKEAKGLSDSAKNAQETKNISKGSRRKGGSWFGWLFKGKKNKAGETYNKKAHKQDRKNAESAKNDFNKLLDQRYNEYLIMMNSQQ